MRKIAFFLLLLLVIIRVISAAQSPLEGKRVRLQGALTQEPREYGTSVLVELRGFSFFLPRDNDIAFGSQLVVEGVVSGDRLQKPTLIKATPPSSVLARARTRILETINRALPAPESALLSGVTIGAPNIPAQFLEVLRATGTSHIVVASGGNMAILAGFLEAVLSRFLKRKLFIPLIALVLTIYSVLCGLGAPIVRALIMWLIILSAQLFGRVTRPLSVLLTTVLVMLLVRPVWLFDVSFQLSVGATAGIMLLSSPLRRKFSRLPIAADVLSTSIAAQVGILPVSILVFRQVQLLSPVWNVLVLWTVPYLTIIGLTGGVISLVSPQLAQVVFATSYPFAWYFVHMLSIV